MKKIYNKLVRDKIPEIIFESGANPEYITLFDHKFDKELDHKLLEEINEYLQAKTEEDKVEELADIIEVIEAIINNKGNMLQVMMIKNEKAKAKGKFIKKYFLESVEEKDND